jgi:hypothetical protein
MINMADRIIGLGDADAFVEELAEAMHQAEEKWWHGANERTEPLGKAKARAALPIIREHVRRERKAAAVEALREATALRDAAVNLSRTSLLSLNTALAITTDAWDAYRQRIEAQP